MVAEPAGRARGERRNDGQTNTRSISLLYADGPVTGAARLNHVAFGLAHLHGAIVIQSIIEQRQQYDGRRRTFHCRWPCLVNSSLAVVTKASVDSGGERKRENKKPMCRLTGHCTVMPLSTFGSLHQSPTSRPDKDSGLPPRTICVFLLSDWLLLDVVLSLLLALVFGTPFLPTSLQHFLCLLSENV